MPTYSPKGWASLFPSFNKDHSTTLPLGINYHFQSKIIILPYHHHLKALHSASIPLVYSSLTIESIPFVPQALCLVSSYLFLKIFATLILFFSELWVQLICKLPVFPADLPPLYRHFLCTKIKNPKKYSSTDVNNFSFMTYLP